MMRHLRKLSKSKQVCKGSVWCRHKSTNADAVTGTKVQILTNLLVQARGDDVFELLLWMITGPKHTP
jgi:hypothetical protein